MIRIPTTQYDAKLEPLKEAVESGNSDFLRRWLEKGQPICNPESKRDSLLSVAVKSRQFSMLEMLLGAGNWREEYPRVLKEYLLRGYSFNARMNQLEDKMDRRLAQHDQAIVDLKEKVDFFVQTKEPPLQGIFYQNKFWDAKSLLIKFIRRAKKELIVIDAYPGVATLDMLAKRGRGVKIELADLRSQNVTLKVDVKEAA